MKTRITGSPQRAVSWTDLLKMHKLVQNNVRRDRRGLIFALLKVKGYQWAEGELQENWWIPFLGKFTLMTQNSLTDESKIHLQWTATLVFRLVGWFFSQKSWDRQLFSQKSWERQLFHSRTIQQLGPTVQDIMRKQDSWSIRSILPLLVLWFKKYAAFKKKTLNSEIWHVFKTSSTVLFPNLLGTEYYFH